MLVFIGNIPGDTPLSEIQKILGSREMLVDYSTHSFRPSNDHDYHYILAKVDSRESADGLISELNGQLFRGLQLEVRHFIKRKKQSRWQGPERRISEPVQIPLLD